MSEAEPAAEATAVEWRDIPGHPGYQVSACGLVRSCRTRGAGNRLSADWHPVRPAATQKGYLQVRTSGVAFYVHRLVLAVFVGPCPAGMECLHRNDTPGDNRVENLRWGTPKENAADRERNGRYARGVARFTEADVAEIRRRAAGGESLASVARDYPLTKSSVYAAVRGTTHGHLPGAAPGRRYRPRLTEQQKAEMAVLWASGVKLCVIAEALGIPVRTVRDAKAAAAHNAAPLLVA